MVEFAIVVPVFLALFFGIADLGRALLEQQQMVRGAEAGVRYLARTYDGLDASDCSTKSAWTAASATAAQLAVYGQESGGVTPLVPGFDTSDITVSVEKRTVDGLDACVVRLEAALAYSGIFGPKIPMLDISLPTLHAASEERYAGQ